MMTKKTRRLSKFTPELASRICNRIANGATLRSICKTKGMPARSVVHRWLNENSEFRQQYHIARDFMADALAEEVLELSKTATDRNVAARRLYSDNIKWYLGKCVPRKYGEKVELNVSGTVTVGDAIEEGRKRVARLRDGENVYPLRPVLSLPAPSEGPLDPLPEVS